MINNIVDAISMKLHKDYPDITIYTDNVSQHLVEPCFLIVPVNPKSTQVLNNRFRRNHLIDVHYFPDTSADDVSSDLRAIVGDLFTVLHEVRDLDDNQFRGSNMRAETVDNVGHVFVNYDFFVDVFEAPGDPMDSLSVSNKIRS